MSVSQQLHTLESSGLITLAQNAPELEYLFRHALVQEVAYASLLKHDRAALHRAVGEALEQLHPDRVRSLQTTSLLARHFDAAGDDTRALKYYTSAGDAALRQYANAEALMHYTRAIDIARRTHEQTSVQHLYQQRGRAFELNAMDAEALANYEEMLAFAQTGADRALELAALIALSTVYVKPAAVRDPEKGQALSDQALNLARALGSREAEAKILWNLMLLNKFDGNGEEGLRYGEQALAIARELDLREQLAYILNDIYALYMFSGNAQQAQMVLQEAQQLWRELGILNMLADSLASMAGLYVIQGQYDRALVVSHEAMEISRAIGNVWNQSYSLFNIDIAYFDRGEIGRAIEVAEECARLGEQAGFVPAMLQAQAELAIIFAFTGAIERGFAALRQLSERMRSQDMLGYANPMVLIAKAHLHFRNGNVQKAFHLFEETQRALVDHAGALGNYVAVYVGLLGAELMLFKGDYAALIGEMIGAVSQLRARGIRMFLQDALYYQARALQAQGRSDEAYDVFEQARIEAEEIGARRIVWMTLFELSRIERQRGHAQAAQHLLGQSREIVRYIAEHTDDAELRESFLNLPHVKAVFETPV